MLINLLNLIYQFSQKASYSIFRKMHDLILLLSLAMLNWFREVMISEINAQKHDILMFISNSQAYRNPINLKAYDTYLFFH